MEELEPALGVLDGHCEDERDNLWEGLSKAASKEGLLDLDFAPFEVAGSNDDICLFGERKKFAKFLDWC